MRHLHECSPGHYRAAMPPHVHVSPVRERAQDADEQVPHMPQCDLEPAAHQDRGERPGSGDGGGSGSIRGIEGGIRGGDRGNNGSEVMMLISYLFVVMDPFGP